MPRLLIVGSRKKQMEYAQAMLPFLHAIEWDGWHYIVIGDKL
jgi:hypothetical protein